NLQGAKLEGANLQGANLQEANLQGAKLEGANLQGARLERANLIRVTLFRADLEGANLEGASLEGANLQGANQQGANLSRAYNLPFDLQTSSKGLEGRGDGEEASPALRLRIQEEPLTVPHLSATLDAFTSLYTKMWLLQQGRFDDFVRY